MSETEGKQTDVVRDVREFVKKMSTAEIQKTFGVSSNFAVLLKKGFPAKVDFDKTVEFLLSEHSYFNQKEIIETNDDHEANRLLNEGWVLQNVTPIAPEVFNYKLSES